MLLIRQNYLGNSNQEWVIIRGSTTCLSEVLQFLTYIIVVVSMITVHHVYVLNKTLFVFSS